MLYFSIDLMVKKSNKAASKLIIVSIFYLSLVQLVFIFDKYFLDERKCAKIKSKKMMLWAGMISMTMTFVV